MSPHIRFRDTAQQAFFDENGYVLCRMMEAGQAEALAGRIRDFYGERLYREEAGLVQSNFYSSFDSDVGVQTRFDDMVQRALQQGVDQIFLDWKFINATCAVKVAGGGQTPLHQDYPAVDTPFGGSFLTWCSLGNTTRENGCLQVVPGSHQLYRHIRAIGSDYSFGAHGPALAEKYAIDVPLGPGEAVIIDLSTWHSAWPNRTEEPRMAVVSNVCGTSARPAKHVATPDGEIVVLDGVDWEELYRFFEKDERIEWTSDKLLKRFPAWVQTPSYSQLEALLLARGPRATVDYDPLETVAHLVSRPAGPSAPTRSEPRWRRAIRRVPGTVGAYRALRRLSNGRRR